LYDAATTSTAPVLLGRVNINTMSQTVLEAIANASSNSAAASSGTAGTGATAGTGTTAGGGTTGAMAGGGTTGGAGNPLLSEQQIEQILASQPMFSGAQALDPSFQCPVWLITEAQIDPATMQKLEPYITTYSQVYSFQSMGYFDSGELAVRFEAVIDLNPSPNNLAGTTGAGTTPTWTPGTGLTCYPRILFQRDISELQGFSNLLPQQQ